MPAEHYLTLTELVANFAVFGGIGYLAAGRIGCGCGVAVVSARYAYLIWMASRAAPAESPVGSGRPEHDGAN